MLLNITPEEFKNIEHALSSLIVETLRVVRDLPSTKQREEIEGELEHYIELQTKMTRYYVPRSL
jgi:hypothetical protein